MTEQFTLLHTNDIHGRYEGLARAATLIERIRESSAHPVVYVDAGDVEETMNRLSNLTRGRAGHELLRAAGVVLEAVGNGGLVRYGPGVLAGYAQAAGRTLLLANLRMSDGSAIPGTSATAMLEIAGRKLGVIGLTEPYNDTHTYERFFSLTALDVPELVRSLAAELRADGADAVMLMSHLGLEVDRALAETLQDEVSLIIGAHTHDHLPHGERVGHVWIAQAGSFAENLGRIELCWKDGGLEVLSISTLPVTDDLEPSARVLETMRQVELEIEEHMNEPVTALAADFELALDRECAAGNLMADAVLAHTGADAALITAGIAFVRSLPAGVLTRGRLFEAAPFTANPGVAEMTGAQILRLLEIGLNPNKAAARPHGLRGGAIGLLHASGLQWREGGFEIGSAPLEETRAYRIAGSDAELDEGFGFVDETWGLKAQFDANVILADALEAYLKSHPDAQPETGRLEGAIQKTPDSKTPSHT
jgi:2',3'-cyclic-nucleotide 2'-phosphodiesterase (5'-nucleotidase family)